MYSDGTRWIGIPFLYSRFAHIHRATSIFDTRSGLRGIDVIVAAPISRLIACQRIPWLRINYRDACTKMQILQRFLGISCKFLGARATKPILRWRVFGPGIPERWSAVERWTREGPGNCTRKTCSRNLQNNARNSINTSVYTCCCEGHRSCERNLVRNSGHWLAFYSGSKAPTVCSRDASHRACKSSRRRWIVERKGMPSRRKLHRSYAACIARERFSRCMTARVD